MRAGGRDSGPSADAELLLREALRAAETHDWVKQALMEDGKGRDLYVKWDGSGIYHQDIGGEHIPVGCDEVTSCCTAGYLRFAEVCLLPLDGDLDRIDRERRYMAAMRKIEALLWERPEVRQACKKAYDEQELGEGLGYSSFDDYVAGEGLDEIGNGEGLVPFWNDNVALCREEVVALLAEALDGLTPA